MVHISLFLLITIYMIGWLASIFIGMFIMDRLWKNHRHQKTVDAFSRGWNAGFGYLQKISDARTEQMSGVRIHRSSRAKEE